MHSGFDDGDGEEEDDNGFELRQALDVHVERIEEAARHCGLYLQHATVQAAVPPTGEPGPTLLMMQFAVGDLAFSTRVLNPPAEEINQAARQMADDQQLADLGRIARAVREGSTPAAGLEAELACNCTHDHDSHIVMLRDAGDPRPPQLGHCRVSGCPCLSYREVR